MRATASLPGCLQRMLGFRALMGPTQSVRYLTQSHFIYKELLKDTELFWPFISVVNLGGLLLQALLEFWPRTRINPMDEEENEVNHGKDVVNSPSTVKSFWNEIKQTGSSVLETLMCSAGHHFLPLSVSSGCPKQHSMCLTVGLCSCVHSEWRAGEQGPKRKWIFPSATTHTSHLWWSRRSNSI